MWHWLLLCPIYWIYRTFRYCFQSYTLQRKPRTCPPFKTIDVSKYLPPAANVSIVVTGGSGFLGSKIIEYLLLQGETQIWNLDIVGPKKVHKSVQFRKCDITNRKQVFTLFNEAKPVIVYHVAALLCYAQNLPHQWERAYKINVLGTKNLRDAALYHNASRFIYTSSSTVVVGKNQAHLNMTEDVPYVTDTTTFSHYQLTKALAEQDIRKSDGTRLRNDKVFHTVCLRPTSMVFGAGEKSGPLSMALLCCFAPLLNGKTMLDVVSVENVAYGELLAEFALRSDPCQVGGQAIGLSNNDPIQWGDLYLLLKPYQPRLVLVTLLPWMYLSSAWISETVQWLFKGKVSIGALDNLSSSTVNLSLKEYTFSPDKAKALLNYRPIYTLDQGLEHLATCLLDIQ